MGQDKARVPRLLGIDPGTVRTGWGVIESASGGLFYIGHGTITCSPYEAQGNRLSRIYHGIQDVLSEYNPEGISLEKLFFARNAQSALKLGQVRGVALLAAAERSFPVCEYSSAEIKQAVVGYGQATKNQVQKMVSQLLGLSGEVGEDAADALAAAICHAHQQGYQALLAGALPGPSRQIRR